MNRTSVSKTIIISITFLIVGYFGINSCHSIPDNPTPFTANIPITSNRSENKIQLTPTNTRQMIITYYSDYRPLSWMDQKGEMHGVFIDVFEEALDKRMGIDVQHKGFPWIRAQEMVRQGEADAFCSTPTEEQKEYSEMSTEMIFENKITLFVNDASPYLGVFKQLDSIDDLSPYTMSNYSGNGWAKQHLNGMNITWVSTPQQALKMVATSRSDAYVDSSIVTNDIIRQNSMQGIIEIPVTFDTAIFYLFIGKSSPYLTVLPEFDATIKMMKETGDLQAIFEKYIPSQ